MQWNLIIHLNYSFRTSEYAFSDANALLSLIETPVAISIAFPMSVNLEGFLWRLQQNVTLLCNRYQWRG